MKEEIFISTLAILVLFNVFVVSINPAQSSILNLDFQGIIVSALSVITVGSVVQIVTGETILRIVFSILLLFNVLFQVHIYGFTVGLGLVNTVFNVFQVYDVLNIGFIVASVLSMLVFFSGMLIIVESA
jgi:hypothetical protein